jgi:tetratricopeptide (TPR) repeat protein
MSVSKATISKRYSIVWVKGNSLIAIIDSFLVLARGVAYANLGEYQKAINDCDQAIILNPNDAIFFAIYHLLPLLE